MPYGENLLSQNRPTEEFMSLDLPLESMKSLANANQALYTYSPPAFSMTLTAKHIKESGGGCGFSPRMRLWLRGCQRRRHCNFCGLEVILFMSK